MEIVVVINFVSKANAQRLGLNAEMASDSIALQVFALIKLKFLVAFLQKISCAKPPTANLSLALLIMALAGSLG